jgi:hypothetical protein
VNNFYEKALSSTENISLNNLVTITPPDDGSNSLPNGWFASVVLVTGAANDYTAVPEPTAVAVVASLGLVGFAAVRRKLMA